MHGQLGGVVLNWSKVNSFSDFGLIIGLKPGSQLALLKRFWSHVMNSWVLFRRIFISSLLFSSLLVGCKKQSEDASPAKSDVAAHDPAATCRTSPKSDSDLKFPYGATCTEIVQKYPSAIASVPAEDKKVLCPFLRMVHRTGVWKQEIINNLLQNAGKGNLMYPLTIKALLAPALEFGCGVGGCKPVAVGVSAGQTKTDPSLINDMSLVDIGNLPDALGVAHDCGYSFGLGEREVNPARRDESLRMFKARAKNGTDISLADIIQVKQENCKKDYQTAKSSGIALKNKVDEANKTLIFEPADTVEIVLIWGYLGGVDNGSINYDDLVDLFNARLPTRKTKYMLDNDLRDFMIASFPKN